MADLLVKIKTTFDNASVKKAFDGISKQAQKSSSKIKSTFSGIDDLVGGQLATLAAGFTVGAIATGLADVAVGSFQAAENAKVATSSFNSLSGGAVIAKANLQAMATATRGLISETEQMQIANQLLGMNIVQTADQLEEVVSVSRQLGKEFKGLGAREAAEEFAIMIANMSVARLDSFGLSSGRVRKRINELMKETQGMTREAAFFQATMEEANKTLERLGPEILTSADEISRLGAEWTNLQAAMGKAAEETGIVKSLISGITGDIVRFTAAFIDDSPEAQLKSLNVQLEMAEDRLTTLTKREEGFLGFIFAAQLPSAANNVKELAAQVAQLTKEQDKAVASAKRQQEIMQAAIRAEELAAERLAKREESEKKFLETQKQFAKDVIDIQSDTANDLADSQETFDDNALDAAEDHAKTLLKIRERAGKAEVKAAKRAQKDLSKIDTNLRKALVKSSQDENKKVAKAQANFAKSDKSERRRKQIDAIGDERLFQLDLRNLAADGQGIAIKEALERRDIEQQIASEKAEFEKEVEQDKREDQIDSIKSEGSERRNELIQQAADRKADLAERNAEAAQSREERLAEEILAENESFAQKKADLAEALIERNEAIKEGEVERIAEIAKGLTETEELTSTQLDRMIELARQFGPRFGEVFAEGMTRAFSEKLKIDAAISAATSIGAGTGGFPIAQGNNGNPRLGGVQQFQTGGAITRSGIAFVDAEEEIANPNIGQAITIGDETFAVRQAERMAAAINSMRQRDMQELVDVVAANL